MAPKKTEAATVPVMDSRDRGIIVNALKTAANAYEADERTFRQVVEDLQSGKPVPMFAAGDAGIKAARKLADGAYTQARDARELLGRYEAADEADEASA